MAATRVAAPVPMPTYTGDNLAGHYSTLADNSSCLAKEREAAMLFSVAEDHLNNDEDFDAAEHSASQAMSLFAELGDCSGESKASRLVVHAFQMKVDALRFDTRFGHRKDVRDTLKEADEFVLEKMAYFREKGHRLGEAAMLLSLAELNVDKRGQAKRLKAMDWAQQALEISRAEKDVKMQGFCWMVLHDVHFRSSQPVEALRCAEQAAELLEEAGDSASLIKALQRVASSHGLNKDMKSCLAVMMQGLNLCRELGLRKLEGFHLNTIASWQIGLERPREAIPAAKEALAIFEELDMGKGWIGGAYRTLVEAHIANHDGHSALRVAKAGLIRFQEDKDHRMALYMHDALARVHFARDENEEALDHGEKALQIARDLDDKAFEASVLYSCCQVLDRVGNLPKAASCLAQVAQIQQRLGNLDGEAEAYHWLFDIHLQTGDVQAARNAGKEALRVFEKTKNNTGKGSTYVNFAKAAYLDGDYELAVTEGTTAQGILRHARDPANEAVAWSLLCDCHTKQQKMAEALQDAKERRKVLQSCEQVKKAASGWHLEAEMQLKNEDYVAAVRTAWQAQVACKKAEDRHGEANALILVITIVVKRAEMEGMPRKSSLEEAARAARDGKLLAKKIGDPQIMGNVIYWQARVLNLTGDGEEALEVASEALPLLRAAKDIKGEGRTHLLIATCHNSLEHDTEAIQEAQEALQLLQEAEDEDGTTEVLQLLARLGVHPGGSTMPHQVRLSPTVAEPQALCEEVGPIAARPSLQVIQAQVMEVARTVVVEAITADSPLVNAGLDSLNSVALRNDLAKALDVALPATLAYDHPSVHDIADYISEVINR